MEGQTTSTDGADALFRCSLLALALAAATNGVVAAIDAVTWAWWVGGACLLACLWLAGAMQGASRELTLRARRGQLPNAVRAPGPELARRT